MLLGSKLNYEAIAKKVIEDGNTVGWYDSQKIDTITKDGSDSVSKWADRLESGKDLVQGVGTLQPLYTDAGIVFDGISSNVFVDISDFNQPEMIYMVLNTVTYRNGAYFMDGNINNSGIYRFSDAENKTWVFAGFNSGVSDKLLLGVTGIVRILFNGAGSKFIVNDNTPITGNFGPNNMRGLTLGSNFGQTNFGNIRFQEVILRNIADSSDNEADIYNYLKNKYSL
jgi:hypothetical protein